MILLCLLHGDTWSNSRNLTVSLNSGDPIRLEVPLSGRHSELFGPGLGWWDAATLGLLVEGWEDGNNTLVLGNDASVDVSQTYAPDIVGCVFQLAIV
jgi:hypothetical protein